MQGSKQNLFRRLTALAVLVASGLFAPGSAHAEERGFFDGWTQWIAELQTECCPLSCKSQCSGCPAACTQPTACPLPRECPVAQRVDPCDHGPCTEVELRGKLRRLEHKLQESNPEIDHFRPVSYSDSVNTRILTENKELHRSLKEQTQQLQDLTQRMESMMREMQMLHQQVQMMRNQPPVFMPVPHPHPPTPPMHPHYYPQPTPPMMPPYPTAPVYPNYLTPVQPQTLPLPGTGPLPMPMPYNNNVNLPLPTTSQVPTPETRPDRAEVDPFAFYNGNFR